MYYKCYLKCNCFNTSFFIKSFFFSAALVTLTLYNTKQSPVHLTAHLSLSLVFPISLKRSGHSCRIYIYFTRQTWSTLPNVFNTSTFIKHKPTNRKNIYLINTFNVKKRSSKIIISKKIKLMYSKSQKISFYNRAIFKSTNIC